MSDPEPDTIRRRLKAGQPLIGGWIQIPHPAIAHLMASSGFDWLALDIEHGLIDLNACAELATVIRAHNCTPFVRLPANDYAQTKRYLDAGVEGVIAPLINTGPEAANLVRSTKYPPEGDRGVGYCLANNFGFEFDAYISRANNDILTCVQIEHDHAIHNLDDILSVPGVDAAFVGPYDLSASMGITAQFDHPRYQNALEKFLDACARHDVAPGIHVVQPEPDQVARRVDEGYRMIAYSLDVTLLGLACQQGVARIRSLLPKSH